LRRHENISIAVARRRRKSLRLIARNGQDLAGSGRTTAKSKADAVLRCVLAISFDILFVVRRNEQMKNKL